MRPARSLLVALLAALAVPAGAQAAPGIHAPTHADTPREIHVDLAAQVRASRLTGVRAVSPDTTQTYLPTTWCGPELTVDDTAHTTLAAGQPFYKLVYAYASDQPDRFAAWKDVLQADVSLIGQYMATQDGATKAPRFDMGTQCGPDYVDIQVVELPGARADYADDFAAIRAAVGQQLGTASAPRDVVILADGLTNDDAGGIYGLGEFSGASDADRPDAANPHNAGGMYAALFPWQGYDPAVAPGDEFYPGFWAEGMLHEITHTLGAVNDSAPHSTGGGHCTDGADVMCYDDGAAAGASYSTSACPVLTGSQAGMTQTYDCNRDDYFDPSPAPGSYLATHWDVFNSVFEASCPTIGSACGSDGPSVPVSIDAPRALGTVQAGRTLTADHGTWSGSPDAFGYRWQRTPVGGGTPVDVVGATGQSYVLGASDVGRRLGLVVVASNATGDSPPASSALTTVVTEQAVKPPPTSVPVVTRPADVFRRVTISLKRGRRTILKVGVTSRATAAGIIATVPSKRAKVARRGSYRLTLCAGAVCITKPFKARHGKARVPTIVAASAIHGPVTLTLIGAGGRATAALP